jgi:hypothetical protein
MIGVTISHSLPNEGAKEKEKKTTKQNKTKIEPVEQSSRHL